MGIQRSSIYLGPRRDMPRVLIGVRHARRVLQGSARRGRFSAAGLCSAGRNCLCAAVLAIFGDKFASMFGTFIVACSIARQWMHRRASCVAFLSISNRAVSVVQFQPPTCARGDLEPLRSV